MSTPQQHRLIGQVIADRYRVEGLLGEGGMGAVYVAEHLTLRKQVALKVVHPEHAGNAELAARFAQEAMVTSRIDHPNVISALDYGTLEDGTAFLAVQLVRGPSLTKVLETEGRLNWQRAAEIGAQVADALSAAHAHGIVHRDLKPENILLQSLDDGGELVKVLDFGVAKIARESRLPDAVRGARQITQHGLVIGTPGYMAPEQAIGSAADHRSDLYSLGVILWESITGIALWEGEDLQAMVEKQLARTAPKLFEVAAETGIPEDLSNLIHRLLARRAEDRPAEATDVRDELREIADRNPAEKHRWRSGARRAAARTPSTVRRLEPLVAVPAPPVPPPAELLTISQAVTAVTPPLRPSFLAGRSARPLWFVTVLVTTILAVGVLLVVTGQLQVRPKGQTAQVAERVAMELNLPPSMIDSAPGAPTESGLPPELDPLLHQLIRAESRELRVSAAKDLIAYVPMESVPTYVRRMAYLQLATRCVDKKAELTELAALKDVRTLPMLLDLADRPKGGCGKRKREDCLACLRDTLAAVIGELKSRARP